MKMVRLEGFGYLLQMFVKLNIKDNEDVSFLKESVFSLLVS